MSLFIWRNRNLAGNHGLLADKDRYKDRRFPSVGWIDPCKLYVLSKPNHSDSKPLRTFWKQCNCWKFKTKWFTNHVLNPLMSPFIHLGHVEIKNLFTWTCRFNFLRLLESGLSSLVGNDFNEKILKSWF